MAYVAEHAPASNSIVQRNGSFFSLRLANLGTGNVEQRCLAESIKLRDVESTREEGVVATPLFKRYDARCAEMTSAMGREHDGVGCTS